MGRSLAKYFAITYAITWTAWGAAFAVSRVSAPVIPGLATVLFLSGTFAPAILALLLNGRASGRSLGISWREPS